MNETLETIDDRRVRLLADQDAPNPRTEWDHLSHVVTIPDRRYADVDTDGGPLADAWRYFLDRLTPDAALDAFQRWARIFHRASTLHDNPHEGPASVWYLLPADIEREGVTDAAAYLTGERDEYRWWAEGNVYGYVIEQRVTWTPTDPSRHGIDTMQTWEEIDSCWGFYGYDNATQAAREAFNARHDPSTPRAFNDPTMACCDRDAADCDCPTSDADTT